MLQLSLIVSLRKRFKQTQGFVVTREDYVCKLNKSLHGLEQSPRQ